MLNEMFAKYIVDARSCEKNMCVMLHFVTVKLLLDDLVIDFRHPMKI